MTKIANNRQMLLVLAMLLAISTLVGECHATWGDDFVDPNDSRNFKQAEVYVFLATHMVHG